MILTRIFDVTLNITNPINFCTNKRSHVLIELNNYYANKCFMGSYIMEILDVLQMSSCRIISSNSTANGTIDVKFLAKVFILNSWDILVGVEIEKNHLFITGKYKKDNMTIRVIFNPTNIQSTILNIGQLVPVRVVQAVHRPKEPDISVAAVVLTCDKKSEYFRVKGEVSKQYLPECNTLLTAITEELEKRKELMKTKKKNILFFESLLYTYKNCPNSNITVIKPNLEWEGPHDITKTSNSIFELLNMDLTGYWTRPLYVCRSSPFVSTTQDKPAEYRLTSPHIMVIDFMNNMLTFLIAIRELTEKYDDTLIESHANIWNIMKNNQL